MKGCKSPGEDLAITTAIKNNHKKTQPKPKPTPPPAFYRHLHFAVYSQRWFNVLFRLFSLVGSQYVLLFRAVVFQEYPGEFRTEGFSPIYIRGCSAGEETAVIYFLR